MRKKLNGVEAALRRAIEMLPEGEQTFETKNYLEKALCLLTDEEEINGL